MAAAVFVAFLALGAYDTSVDDYGHGLFGTAIASTDVIAIVVLLYGMDVYGRDQEPEVEAITNFSP
jgi:Na+/H+-translocating membrane pyrophosphatase